MPTAALAANARTPSARAVQFLILTLQVGGAAQQAAIVQTIKGDTALNPIRNSEEYRQVFEPKPQPEPAAPNGPEKPDTEGQKPGEQK